MSFREPLVLIGLALLPLAVVAYLLAQRRRRRYAVRYTNLDVLATVAGRDWLRPLAPLLALLALAVLVVALARPERTVAAPQRQATTVLVTDTSGSMQATDVRPDRISAAKTAARTLVNEVPRDFRLGLVSFNSVAEQQAAPTTDRSEMRAAIDGLQVRGATAMGDGLALGLDAARVPVADGLGGTRRLPAALVLISDGASTRGEDPLAVARRARRLRVPVYTVALGTQAGVLERTRADGTTAQVPVPPDVDTLREIARTTGGRFFKATDSDRLKSIFTSLSTRLATTREKQEVTAAFAGGALVLVLIGGILSLLRTGRLP